MRRLARATAILLALVALVLAALPWAVPFAVAHFVDKAARQLKIPLDVRTDFGYCWTESGPGVRLATDLRLPNTHWGVAVRAKAAFARYEATVTMPSVTFDETDALLAEMLRRYPVPAVSNLTFGGSVALDASVRRTWSFPVPEWKVEVPICDFRAAGTLGETPVSVTDLTLKPTAAGILDRVAFSPLRVRARNIQFGGHVLTNFHASAWTTRKTLLVSEAGAGYCGGDVRLNALYLEVDDLNAGCTLYFENLDARQLMASCAGFRGRATGRLNGRVPLSLRKGSRIRLHDAFLYSPPGEQGMFALEDPERFTDYLAMSGLDAGTRENAARVLENVDYDVLRLNLEREGDGLVLRFTLRGSATRGETTVPVNVDLALHGDIEQLVNAGLKLTGRKETLR